MDRTAPAPHAGHDQLLIARLYGGDVDENERDLALDLVADCPECAGLFADLGEIAQATVALPVPSRPRDFTLTAADAARLGHGSPGWRAIFGAGLRRSLGGSLATLGLVGAVLTGSMSVLGGMGGTAANLAATTAEQQGLPADNGTSPGDMAFAAQTPTPASSTPTISTPTSPSGQPGYLMSPGVVSNTTGQDGRTETSGPSQAAPPSETEISVASPSPHGAVDGGGKAIGPTAPAAESSQGGFDARLVWMIGFGALFAIGLAILILPWLMRGRGRRTPF
jgi:hypothetical protein